MPARIGIVGFVNTEEVVADTIKRQTPDVLVDGYEVLPNEAFGRVVDNRFPLYGVNESNEFGFHNLHKLGQIRQLGYASVSLGPIPAAFIAGNTLDETSYDYVGPRQNELSYELDKTKIVDIFPNSLGILPPTEIIEKPDVQLVNVAIDRLGGRVVVKFVGEYPKYYSDSETRRVRFIEEFENLAELEEFVNNSIADSGKLVIQKFIEGQQFSYTCLVDDNDGIFSLGENICYKNRHDGDEGPLCDGVGAISVNNTLPGIITREDSRFIEEAIVRPYNSYLEEQFGRHPKTFLNLDLIKSTDGKVYLLEVNHREAGGHTMASLLAGLETPLAEALIATKEGRLNELKPSYKEGSAVVVSAYPENFPYSFSSEEARPILKIPKMHPVDNVRMYTGWVDVLDEDINSVTVKAQLSPIMLAVSHAKNLKLARQNVYEYLRKNVPTGLVYRTDIGKTLDK